MKTGRPRAFLGRQADPGERGNRVNATDRLRRTPFADLQVRLTAEDDRIRDGFIVDGEAGLRKVVPLGKATDSYKAVHGIVDRLF